MFKDRWVFRCNMGCEQEIQWKDVFPNEPHPDEQQIKNKRIYVKYNLFRKGLVPIAMFAYFVNAYVYFPNLIALAAIFYFICKILFMFTPKRFVQPAFWTLMLSLTVGNGFFYARYFVKFAFFLLLLMFGNFSTFVMFYFISCVIFIAAILHWDLHGYNSINLTSVETMIYFDIQN